MNEPTGVPAAAAARNIQTGPTKNLINTALGALDVSIYATAVEAAGLTKVLSVKGPYTIFAPTDAAFKKLPAAALEALLKDSGKLKAILNYHCIAGFLTSRDFKSGELMTLQGTKLTAAVEGSVIHINGALLMQADLVATNGVVHTLDSVILPKNWQLLANAA